MQGRKRGSEEGSGEGRQEGRRAKSGGRAEVKAGAKPAAPSTPAPRRRASKGETPARSVPPAHAQQRGSAHATPVFT